MAKSLIIWPIIILYYNNYNNYFVHASEQLPDDKQWSIIIIIIKNKVLFCNNYKRSDMVKFRLRA